MRIGETSPSTVAELWAKLEPQVEQAKSLEEAAQTLATLVHTCFQESVVLSRVFLTVPFFGLPPTDEQFVRKVAESAGVGSDLKRATPILSLLGTQGQEPDWNERHKSKGHLGIPLISSTFVDSVPMISRLLKDLGIPLSWVDSYDSEIIEKAMLDSSSLFFVENAASATDFKGRKIIAAQDFVSTYGVKTVFGTGAAYAGGQIVVLIVFCGDVCSRAVAARFLALSTLFASKTKRLVGIARIFSLW